MIKSLKIYLSLSLFIFFHIACNKFGCPTSSGSSSNKIVDLPVFKQIILYDKINLILTYDSLQSVKIETGKNMLSGIQTTVADSILTIRNNNTCNLFADPSNQVNIYISGNQLQNIAYYGAGNITSTNTLYLPEFRMDAWKGSGSVNLDLVSNQAYAIVRTENVDITFKGHSNYTYVYASEAGSINLQDFSSVYMDVEQKSVRDMYIRVTDSLHANILYKGNLYYTGNPRKVDSYITSTGKLIQE